jgi:CHASE3 domain
MYRMTPSSPGNRRNTATLGLAALVLMAIVGVSYRAWSQYNRANAEAAQTQEIVDSVDQLLSNLTDAETGQRGFLSRAKIAISNRTTRRSKAFPTSLRQSGIALRRGRANRAMRRV